MNANNIILHLSLIDGVGPGTIASIIRNKPKDFSWQDVYAYKENNWMHIFGLSSSVTNRMVTGLRDIQMLEKERAAIERNAISWTTIINPDYPSLLKAIHLPPAVLYYKGAQLAQEQKRIAIIGSRNANQYAQHVINTLVPQLVAHDWHIVSGGAIGADSMAHRAAVTSQGKTIVVLGSGLLQPYPARNNQLFDQVLASGGALVSAFPLYMQAQPGNFPARNRIISGLSQGCLVVQAAEKSGARITVEYALEQGREVFAIPGPIGDPLSAGCHALIQDGAKLVHCVQDILHEFGEQVIANVAQIEISETQSEQRNFLPSVAHNNKAESKKQAKSMVQNRVLPFAAESFAAKIIQVCATPCSVDELAEKTGLDLVALQAELFDLQLEGYVKQDFTGMWQV